MFQYSNFTNNRARYGGSAIRSNQFNITNNDIHNQTRYFQTILRFFLNEFHNNSVEKPNSYIYSDQDEVLIVCIYGEVADPNYEQINCNQVSQNNYILQKTGFDITL